MNKVLFIGVGLPWTKAAGYLVRQRNHLEALSKCSELDAVFYSNDIPEKTPFMFGRVHYLKMPRVIEEYRFSRAFRDLFTWTPRRFRLQKSDLRESRLQLEEIIQGSNYRAVFVYSMDILYWSGLSGRAPIFLDVDDWESERERRRIEVSQVNLDFRTRLDLWKLKRRELSLASGAQTLFFSRESDRGQFRGKRSFFIPNTISEGLPYAHQEASQPTLFFAGGYLPGTPNYDALQWFLSDVWPRISAQIPNARCVVAGMATEKIAETYPKLKGVEAYGYLETLSPQYTSAWAAIAPIRYGTGTRIKILEALSYGVPVVSTTLGCEGLDLKPGSEILIADSADAFAQSCIELLQNRTRRLELQSAAKAWAKENLDPKKALEKNTELFKQALQS